MSDVFDKCSAWKDYRIAKATGLYPYFRPIEASYGSTEVDMDGRRVIMVGSNNYLGLAGDPPGEGSGDQRGEEVRQHLLRLAPAQRHPLAHEELEAAAREVHEPRGVPGRLHRLPDQHRHRLRAARPPRIVFSDRQNHASLVDGVRLSFGEEKRYRHNDMEHLEKLLAGTDIEAGKLILTDGVFSMEGDICTSRRSRSWRRSTRRG